MEVAVYMKHNLTEEEIQILLKYCNDTISDYEVKDLLWPVNDKTGICSCCDYGSNWSRPRNYNPKIEHSPTCSFVKVVTLLNKLKKENI
jgi:uncharacterized protein YqeY